MAGEEARESDMSQWVSSFAWETNESLPFAWATSRPLPVAWTTSGSLLSVQNYRPYIVFSSSKRKYEHPLHLTYWLVIGTYVLPFFPVICWAYLQTEISVTLSLGYKLYSSPSSFIFSTLLMLSCDCIESSKFIVTS